MCGYTTAILRGGQRQRLPWGSRALCRNGAVVLCWSARRAQELHARAAWESMLSPSQRALRVQPPLRPRACPNPLANGELVPPSLRYLRCAAQGQTPSVVLPYTRVVASVHTPPLFARVIGTCRTHSRLLAPGVSQENRDRGAQRRGGGLRRNVTPALFRAPFAVHLDRGRKIATKPRRHPRAVLRATLQAEWWTNNTLRMSARGQGGGEAGTAAAPAPAPAAGGQKSERRALEARCASSGRRSSS